MRFVTYDLDADGSVNDVRSHGTFECADGEDIIEAAIAADFLSDRFDAESVVAEDDGSYRSVKTGRLVFGIIDE